MKFDLLLAAGIVLSLGISIADSTAGEMRRSMLSTRYSDGEVRLVCVDVEELLATPPWRPGTRDEPPVSPENARALVTTWLNDQHLAGWYIEQMTLRRFGPAQPEPLGNWLWIVAVRRAVPEAVIQEGTESITGFLTDPENRKMFLAVLMDERVVPPTIIKPEGDESASRPRHKRPRLPDCP